MGSRAFRQLVAYRKACDLAGHARSEVFRWGSFDRWTVGLQLVRAADSIGANIAEGTGRWHGADRRRLFFIARGSLYETEHWLLESQRRGLIEWDYTADLDEAARTLNGLIRQTSDRATER